MILFDWTVLNLGVWRAIALAVILMGAAIMLVEYLFRMISRIARDMFGV